MADKNIFNRISLMDTVQLDTQENPCYNGNDYDGYYLNVWQNFNFEDIC